MLTAEDRSEGTIQATMPIIRDGDVAALGALEIAIEPGNGGSLEGVMAGMLPAGAPQ